jgi:hypothetical protein
MCRSGAPDGAHLVTFGARVRCASRRRRSAVLARTSASRKVTSDSAPITNRRRSPQRSLEPAASTARVAGRGEGKDLGVQRRLWELFAFASGAAAAAACRRGMTALWRVSRRQDPPENPASRGVRWRDALIWSISLGVGAAVSRLVAQRGAAAAWQAATGSQPPGLDDRAE